MHHTPNNIPSQGARGGIAQESRPDNRRSVNQNLGMSNSNPVYQPATQQASNMTVCL